MIGLVLLQRSEGGGLGMGGGGGGFMTSRGTANVLTRATAILAAVFFATSLVLSILAGFDRKPRSILQDPDARGADPQPAAPGGTAPLAPGGVLDRLQGRSAGAAAVAVGAAQQFRRRGRRIRPRRLWRALRMSLSENRLPHFCGTCACRTRRIDGGS